MEKLDKKRVMEAALFISARELSLSEMGKIVGIKEKRKIKKIIDELRGEYSRNGSAIEIFQNGEKYLMRVGNQYADQVKEFAQDSEISKGALRVLSYVHMNEGNILKSKIAKKLGSWIYPYVKELEEKEFITSKKAGRTKRLITTDKFKRYFGE